LLLLQVSPLLVRGTNGDSLPLHQCNPCKSESICDSNAFASAFILFIPFIPVNLLLPLLLLLNHKSQIQNHRSPLLFIRFAFAFAFAFSFQL